MPRLLLQRASTNDAKRRTRTMNTLDKELHESVKARADKIIEKFFFEPNDRKTRNCIGIALDSMLREMDELEDFCVIVDESNNTEERINNNELWVDLAVQPKGTTQFYCVPIRVVPK